MQMILTEHFSCCLFCNPTASWGGSLVAMPVAPLSTHSRAWIDIQTGRHTDFTQHLYVDALLRQRLTGQKTEERG